VKSFLLVVWDGDRMRAFHPLVMDPFDRQMVEEVAMRLIGRADRLVHAPLPQPADPLSFSPALSPGPVFPDALVKAKALTASLELARLSGYSGDTCQRCHGLRVRRTGTCLTCEDCHSNEGCG
jgi:hypothetical protein